MFCTFASTTPAAHVHAHVVLTSSYACTLNPTFIHFAPKGCQLTGLELKNLTKCNELWFRQGKIPLAMIISQYGGQRNFKIACLEGVLTKGFELAAMNKMVVQESLRVSVLHGRLISGCAIGWQGR
eukprot:1157850-Pelagomonas_calceolata.AAC.16